jgi:hypothetical protein
MHCTSCGKEIADQAKFCAYCGAEVVGIEVEHNHQPQKESVNQQSLVGFSKKISDPAFDKYLSNTKKYGKQFTVGLVVLLFIGFGIYGTVSDEMEFIQAMLIASLLGGVYLTWTFIALSRRGKKEDWDGVVIDKKKKRKTRSQGSGDDSYNETYIQHQVIIKKDNGKKHVLKHDDTDVVYNYYQIGDKVRFHGKLNSLEKYDKSHDSIIFCSACASINKIEDDVCFRCKCPLLK